MRWWPRCRYCNKPVRWRHLLHMFCYHGTTTHYRCERKMRRDVFGVPEGMR